MRRQAGFTLIEIMIVITLIGILAGFIIVNATAARRVARDRKRVADIQLIHSALQAYRKESPPTYPPASLNVLVPTYFLTVPSDPQGGAYTYRTNPPGCPANYYIVYANLETAGVTDARNDQSCWSGNNDQIYVVTGR